MTTYQISVEAGRLLEAVTVAIPAAQKAKPYPVTIRFDDFSSMLRIIEARHGTKGHELAASGTWPDKVQIDGRKLRALAGKFKPDAIVTLTATADTLVLSSGSFKLAFDRIDTGGKGGIKETAMPKNPKHRGPVVVPPDPVGKRVELDATWRFTARMPVRQHRKPRE